MAKNSITDYSKTAASNTDIQSVDIAEGCLPSGINNAIREIMADLADMNDGTVTLTSPSFAAASLTGNLSFGDSDKAIFGAGSDLEIYHNGTDSFIDEKASGWLYIRANDMVLGKYTGETYVKGIADGAVELYHDNAKKIETTSTGIDVTGTVTADGLTVDGVVDVTSTTSLSTNLQNTGGSALLPTYSFNGSADVGMFAPSTNNLAFATFQVERMRITSGGNIQIGSTNSGVAGSLDVSIGSTSTSGGITLFSPTNGTHSIGFADGTSGTDRYRGYVEYQHPNDALAFATSATERMRIDSSGNVGIGTSSPSAGLHIDNPSNSAITAILDTDNSAVKMVFRNNTETGNNVQIGADGSNLVALTNGTERMRIDSSGNVLVGTTSTSRTTVGHELHASGFARHTADGDKSLEIVRKSSDGEMVEFFKDSTLVGSIGVVGGTPFFSNNNNSTGIRIYSSGFAACNASGAFTDNTQDVGASNVRWDDIYATNGTIQTSDQNEKQDIEALSEAEQRVAVAAKGLLRKFRWKDSVEEKGDDARIHFGIIAQDLQAAFEAEGLDAGRYAMFINSTWTDEETGEERSRMGVRYNQLLAFIIAAI